MGEKLRYGAEAAVFFAFMGLFRVIGLETACAPGRLDRAQSSFPAAARPGGARQSGRGLSGKAGAERNAIRRTMWDNLGRVVGEYPHLDHFSPNGEDPRITYDLPTRRDGRRPEETGR